MSITALAKQKFGKPLAASALALSMAFAPIAANDATAADRSASTTTSTQQQSAPPIMVKRYYGKDSQAIMFGVARVSAQKDKMMIVYVGDDQMLQDRVAKAAARAKKNGADILAMIVVDPFKHISNNKFTIISNGGGMIHPRDPSTMDVAEIAALISDTDIKIFRPRLLEEQSKTVASNSLAANSPN